MTTAEDLGIESVQAATILERSVCLILSCQSLGNHKTIHNVSLRTIEGDAPAAEEGEWSASKRLLRGRDLGDCNRISGRAKDFLKSVSTNTHRVFGHGTYLIPLVLVSEVEERLTVLKDELRAAVDELVEVYPGLVSEREEQLGHLFDPSDYRTPAELRMAFGLEWSYVSFAAPDRLEAVDRAAYETARRQYSDKLSSAFDEVMLGLRQTAVQILKDLKSRLEPGKDGKRKALRMTALDDLHEFMTRLDVRNITGDTELPAALEAVTALSRGMDVEQLKDDEELRQHLHDEAQKAVEVLDGLIQPVSRRGVSLGGLFDEGAAQ